jgi:hypothetical protein
MFKALLCYLSDISFPGRMETDTAVPTREQFTNIFNKVDKEGWNKYDDFLRNLREKGKNNKWLE